jgi:uracil phosphoribosyltransferase
MAVYEQRHPLIQHKIGLLRASKTGTKQCRELVAEIARLLTYEATRDLPLEPATVEAWCGNVEVEQLQGRQFKSREKALIAQKKSVTGLPIGLKLF